MRHLRIYRSVYRRQRRRRFLVVGLTLVFAPVLAVAIFVASRPAWRMLDTARITDTAQSLHILDADGHEISLLYNTENRVDISLSVLPDYVKNAFIAAEDARFYTHPGIDVIRIAGAALNDLRAQAYVEGASTITQQLIKLSHLTSEKELTRKVDEAILAYLLEQRYTKDEILELYLNYAYFGNGCYGIEAAARGYFGVHAKDLSLAQGAMLAGVLKSPRTYSPVKRAEAAVGRRNVILSLMADYRMITEAEESLASQEPFIYAPDPVINHRGYYVDLVLTTACETTGLDMVSLLESGYTIRTVMNSQIQQIVETRFADDRYFPALESGEAQAAIVIVDASSGGVAALLGGRDSGIALAYNHATRIRRQPGSAIKPILVYAPALEAGYTATSMLLDEQTTFVDYSPQNASGIYRGWVTMREAVTKSLNVPAVSLFSELGIHYCKNFASRVGIPFDTLDKRLALALGGFTYGVSPYQLAGAYATFASGGIYRKPYLISAIDGRDGESIFTYQGRESRVMGAGNAFILTSMLESVVDNGTGRALSDLNMPLAAKTGTVGDQDGNRDLWLCCYNSEYAMVVWMGCDDSAGGSEFAPDTGGGTWPAYLLHDVIADMYAGREKPRFQIPMSVVRVRLDNYTLKTEYTATLAGTLTPDSEVVYEYYVRGTEPTAESGYWSMPVPPTDITVIHVDQSVFVSYEPASPYVEYRLYREDEAGYSVLAYTFPAGAARKTFEDDVSELTGVYTYYLIPVHPRLTIDGVALVGESSQRYPVLLGISDGEEPDID